VRVSLALSPRLVPDDPHSAVEEKYHAPIWVVHRADLQACLLNAGKRLGVDLRTSARVVDIESGSEPGQPTRVCVQKRGEEGGTWEEVDVVVAADGIRSPARAAMMKKQGTVDEGQWGSHL
jgi:salicylate hydroxylase